MDEFLQNYYNNRSTFIPSWFCSSFIDVKNKTNLEQRLKECELAAQLMKESLAELKKEKIPNLTEIESTEDMINYIYGMILEIKELT